MSIYKRGRIYWYKFMWNGEPVRESTKQGNDRVARNMESAHRTALANGLVGIRERKQPPTLADFLRHDFLPFAEVKHAAKPLTLRYYRQGSDMLTKSSLSNVRLCELTDQHVQEFARKHSTLSPSGINRGLRTLRRALNLAYRWGKLEKPCKVALVAGEHQRDRVLTQDESAKYLSACPQPWKDCATIILDEGFRPGEVFALRWSHILMNNDGTGVIQIVAGKSKAARRVLPMTPRVHGLLRERHEGAGCPEDGWVFPASSNMEQHITDGITKFQHRKALDHSEVPDFVPYVLRHTALTRLGEAAAGDVFVLARIAGHSSITITQRYIHPQADAISRVFRQVGTKLGTVAKRIKKKRPRAEKETALKAA